MANEMQGVRDTLNINIAEVVRDVDTRVVMLEPDKANLIVLLDDLGSREVHNTAFEWQEDTYVSEHTEIAMTGGYDGNAVNLVLSDSKMIVVGDMIIVPRTKEVMRVIANNPATGIITVVRDVTGTQILGTPLLDQEPLYIFSNSYEEGLPAPTSVSTQVQLPWNYIQIIKNDIAMTYSQRETDTYKGKDMPYQRKKRFTEHLLRLEKTTLFGRRGITAAGLIAGRPERYTGGLEQFIATNMTTIAGGIITEMAWDQFLRGVFTYGSKRKLILCNSMLLLAVTQWAKNRLILQQSSAGNKYGLSIYNYTHALGNCLLARSELLTGAVYGTYAFALDMEYLRKVHQQNLNTQKARVTQVRNAEIEEEVIFTHYGVERKFERAHGLLMGVTGYI